MEGMSPSHEEKLRAHEPTVPAWAVYIPRNITGSTISRMRVTASREAFRAESPDRIMLP